MLRNEALKAVSKIIHESKIVRRRLQPYSWSEFHLLPQRRPLIKHLLDCSAMSVVYGEPNAGKTFLVIQIAIHIAMGKCWRDLQTRQGAVVYVAAEAGLGIVDRFIAFHTYHEINGYPPLHLIPTSIDLCNAAVDTTEIIEEIQRLENVQIVIIDTLSRALAGGNENSPDNMGAFIKNCDKIREVTGAHVMIVHHSGKEVSRGARGHSSLKAAIDTEIEVSQNDGIVTAKITKQRDGRTGDQYSFILEEIPVNQNAQDNEKTSCVLLPTDNVPQRKQKLSDQNKKAYEILLNLIDEKGEKRPISKRSIGKAKSPTFPSVYVEEFEEALKESAFCNSDKKDSFRKAKDRAFDALESAGIIDFFGKLIFIKNKADNDRQTEKENAKR